MLPKCEVIGVISDTHLSGPRPDLLALLRSHLGDCTRLVHCGDVVDPSVLEALGQKWEVLAVRGNMDPDLGIPRRSVHLVQDGHRVADRTPLVTLGSQRFDVELDGQAGCTDAEALDRLRHRIRNRFR